jgi:hypothetical protein
MIHQNKRFGHEEEFSASHTLDYYPSILILDQIPDFFKKSGI